jgi:predicted transcriptional regulator with HTH domain
MDFKLKTRLFEYFGVHAKREDSYKDSNGKGINERYQESVGEDYDDNLSDLMDNLFDRTLQPKTMLSKLIPHMEDMLGNPVIVLNDVPMRRKILQFVHHIYNIRSTHKSYEVLFRMLGFDTVTVQEFVITVGFDSDVTFDDPVRTFDGTEKFCSEYSVHLTGTIGLDAVKVLAINRIIKFLEPINAHLREVTYNGDPISIGLILVYIENGNQYYDNANDPGITLVLEDGKLYKDGVNAGNYVMIDGYLYFQS